jgi:uncharacterized protein (TIGR01777 family)
VPGITRVGWAVDGTAAGWGSVVEAADAVINLSGESLAAQRWSPEFKKKLRDSRLQATRGLVAAINTAAQPPAVFISGSAVGYYGPSDNRPLTESDPAGSDFLATLCADWESEARRAERTRVALLRTGVVLERSGGALVELMRPFKFFAGGPIGSGRQYVSWIHRLDWIEIVRWLVQTPDVSGPVNATAPHPVTNRQLARALGHALHRPSFVPAPAFAVKIALGEFADSIVTGQRVIPARAQKDGYHFRYPDIEQAFRGIFGE